MSKHGFIICSLVVLLSLPSLSLAQDKGNSAVSRIAQAEQKNHDARDRDQARDREEERGRGQDRDHDHDEDRDDHDLNKVTVSLAAPADNTLVTAPGAVTLTADASVSQRNWAILRVEYYQGASLIGSATAAPYSVNWSNVPAGNYTLTAKAIATNRGQSKDKDKERRNSPTWEAVSAPVSLTVNAPPTVALTGPTISQSYIAPASVTVTANATDSDGTIAKVEFYQGGTLIGTATAAPYTATWANAPAGSYTITAKATDDRGAVTISAPIQIVVDAPPTVTLTSPTANQTYIAPASVTLTANAADSDGTVAKVEFYQGATLIGTATAAPYTATWQNAPAGSYTLTAKATDDRGASTTSAPVQIVVDAPPTVSLTSPVNNAVFVAPASITLNADAADSDGNIAKVEFYQGGTLIGTATAAPYSVTWANASAGTYTITAKATDNQGATITSAAILITVIPNQLPSITLTTPTAGQRFTAPATINFTASAQDIDGQITRVEYYQGTTLIATATTAPYAATWQNVPEGQYSLTAKAIDNGGGETYSSAVSLTVAPAGMRIYYLHSDHLNTPRVVTDEQNRIVWRNAPLGEPFGNAAPEEDPDGDGIPFTLNLRFPGQYYDRETNLSYNYFRDYDPNTGRYIQSDPIGLKGGINGYIYALNTPTIAIDPTGLYCIFSDGTIIKLTPTSTTRKIVEREWETLLAVPVPSPNVPSPGMGFPWPGMELMWQVTKHQSGYLERLFKSTMGGIWRCYDDCGKMTFQGWGTKEGPDQWQKDGNFEDSFPGKTHRGGSPSPDDLPRIPQPRIPR